MELDLGQRAELHAALGEPVRLAIVDELVLSDRSPSELGARLGIASNLLAHHLDVLEEVGLIGRVTSSADRRRRYITLRREPLVDLASGMARPVGDALFVCSHNSARSQLAAALWLELTGNQAASAGTAPAERVHPSAVAAGRRHGLDLSQARPCALEPDPQQRFIVTVCDQAHEEASIGDHWHWSIPDPVPVGTDEAFDAVVVELEQRMAVFLTTLSFN